MRLPPAAEELRSLGLRGTCFRLAWEAGLRTGWIGRRPPDVRVAGEPELVPRLLALPFCEPAEAGQWMRENLPARACTALRAEAESAGTGLIRCFRHHSLDFGHPIRWRADPVTGTCWPRDVPWPKALAAGAGDPKSVWEAARFPQGWVMARAAACFPERRQALSAACFDQITDFAAQNPYGRGIHWASSQEVVIRLMAWVFAARLFVAGGESPGGLGPLLVRALAEGGAHVSRYLPYARKAVSNNHLLAEACGLYLIGTLVPEAEGARHWVELGRELLTEQAARQFYPDGGYIQQSHNYHRLAIDIYLWAFQIAVARQETPDEAWRAALERSVRFLANLQNEANGRLPNYGANDGALASVADTCEFADFRGVLQTASIAATGARLYPPGPWDERAVWWFGPDSLKLPLRPMELRTASFPLSGHHVLRDAPGAFAAFRCGALRDRFSQIDMLHLDVWWRGHNVLADPGSYRYNGEPRWHNHFFRTASHNTVTVGGRDQMLHYRQFKTLYPTQARWLGGESGEGWSLGEGEHYGYSPWGRVHRRAVLQVGGDLWVVCDRIEGTGDEHVRLHWLAGLPSGRLEEPGTLRIETPDGPFFVAVYGDDGGALAGDDIAGQDDPPRGWLSRHYGEKTPVPSFAVERSGMLPLTLVSVLGPAIPEVEVQSELWRIRAAGSEARFRLVEGRFKAIEGGALT